MNTAVTAGQARQALERTSRGSAAAEISQGRAALGSCESGQATTSRQRRGAGRPVDALPISGRALATPAPGPVSR